MEWTENDLMPMVGEYMAQISMGVYITLRTLLNLLIGIIVCVYFLNSKELFKAQTKKLISATMNKEKSDEIFEFAYFTNRVFVFKSKEKNMLKEASTFVVSRILSLFMDMFTMFIIVSVLHLNDKIGKLVSQVIVTIANYILSKLFVFKTKKKR